jgi:hypothetical protein
MFVRYLSKKFFTSSKCREKYNTVPPTRIDLILHEIEIEEPSQSDDVIVIKWRIRAAGYSNTPITTHMYRPWPARKPTQLSAT